MGELVGGWWVGMFVGGRTDGCMRSGQIHGPECGGGGVGGRWMGRWVWMLVWLDGSGWEAGAMEGGTWGWMGRWVGGCMRSVVFPRLKLCVPSVTSNAVFGGSSAEPKPRTAGRSPGPNCHRVTV